MGNKYKKYDLTEHLGVLEELFEPVIGIEGEVDLNSFENQGLVAHLLAVMLNVYFMSGKERELGGFGADDIYPIRITVEQSFIEYWGKISWLSTPKNHQCYRSFLDPFYGRFELTEEGLVIYEIFFGDYSKKDVETDWWVQTTIDWIYEIEL